MASEKFRVVRDRQWALVNARKAWAKGVEAPLSSLNRWATLPREVKGPILISQVLFPAPEDELQQLLFRALDEIDDGRSYQRSQLVPARGEWVSPWLGGHGKATDGFNEQEKYVEQEKHVQQDSAIVFYVHGGAYTSGSPAQVRLTTGRLALATHGRVFATTYRLAPSHTMPAQLLDILSAYFALLNPPPNAFHSPIPAHRVVIVADSCGASLSLSLLAFLLHLTRQSQPLQIHGRPLPQSILPAGCAFISPFLNSCHHLPHFFHPAPREHDVLTEENPLYYSGRCDEPGTWPTNPPREHWLCSKCLLLHPLTEPMLLPEESWTGAPPVWIAVGEERGAAAMELLLANMARGGVQVHMEVFEGMCHLWHVMLPQSPSAPEGLKRLGNAVTTLYHHQALDNRRVAIEEATMRERDMGWSIEFQTKQQWLAWVEMVKEKNNKLPIFEGLDMHKGRL
ncbi:MAG: hypothetical protein Q9162_001544 [Coniocarpon cinnabarinum]